MTRPRSISVVPPSHLKSTLNHEHHLHHPTPLHPLAHPLLSPPSGMTTTSAKHGHLQELTRCLLLVSAALTVNKTKAPLPVLHTWIARARKIRGDGHLTGRIGHSRRVLAHVSFSVRSYKIICSIGMNTRFRELIVNTTHLHAVDRQTLLKPQMSRAREDGQMRPRLPRRSTTPSCTSRSRCRLVNRSTLTTTKPLRFSFTKLPICIS